MEKAKLKEGLEKIVHKRGLEGKFSWTPETFLDDLLKLLPIKSLGDEPIRMITEILPCEWPKDGIILDKLSPQDIEDIKEKFKIAKAVRGVVGDIDKAGLLEIKESDPRIARMGFAIEDFGAIGTLARLEAGIDIFGESYLLFDETDTDQSCT